MEEIMLESEIETKIRKYVRKEYPEILFLKFTSPGRRGVPDRVLLGPEGKKLWMELKRPGGKIRRLQERFIAQLNQMGHRAVILDNIESAKLIISEVFDAN